MVTRDYSQSRNLKPQISPVLLKSMGGFSATQKAHEMILKQNKTCKTWTKNSAS